MIWGYAGLVVIAFLLTAVATWTGQPPTRGKALAGLTAFGCLRVCVRLFPAGCDGKRHIRHDLFFWYGAVCGFAGNPFSKQAQLCCRICYFVLGGTHFAFI